MRVTSLPSAGRLSNGFRLRTEAAKAISAVEIVAMRSPGGKAEEAGELAAFFTAAAAAATAVADEAVPTVVTRVRTAVNTATITFNEPLDTTVAPPTSAFVFTPARTVTAVSVAGSTVVITATGTVAGDSVAYTAPSTNYVRDLVGNAVASFSGVLS